MPCRKEIIDDPASIKQVKKCEKNFECVYESYDKDNIESTSARCILGDHIGNL